MRLAISEDYFFSRLRHRQQMRVIILADWVIGLKQPLLVGASISENISD